MRQSVVLSLALTALLALAADNPGAPAPPGQFELTKDEQTLLELTNKARAAEKLPPLKPDPILFQVARAHSANMLKKGEMKHELDGKNPIQRVEASGYDYKRVGENIGWTQDAPVEFAMKGWMESKVHRDNILSPNYTEIGLGLVGNAKGEVYYTQVFAAPRKK